MKIVAISDTHGFHRNLYLPEADTLIHAGDSLRFGKLEEFADFMDWFGQQDYKHRIFIAGNHDQVLEDRFEDAEKFIPSGVTYLRDSSVQLDGLTFYGAPWTPRFFSWAFMKSRGESIRERWQRIPEKVDVLITHGPPYGQGDLAPAFKTPFKRNVGCLELLLRVKRVNPTVHIFGHIHGGYGVTQSDEVPATTFVNAAICTENYAPEHKPIVFEVGEK